MPLTRTTPLFRLAALFSLLFAASIFSFGSAHAGEIASGSGWDKVGKKTSGSWSVIEEDGVFYVELGDDFKTRNAPDLKIYLSTADATSLNNNNGIDEAVFISKLTSNKGAQRYALPDGVLPYDFTSLVIYCEAFSKFWAASTL